MVYSPVHISLHSIPTIANIPSNSHLEEIFPFLLKSSHRYSDKSSPYTEINESGSATMLDGTECLFPLNLSKMNKYFVKNKFEFLK